MNEFDVFGEAISDYYFNGEKSSKIIVHEKGQEDDFIDPAYLFRSVRKLPLLEKEALTHCKGYILDVGAGAGSHSLILQNMNLKVKAIDISEKSVEVMVKRGVKETEVLNVFQLKKPEFDTILLLMNGIGIAGTLYNLDNFLVHLKSLLKPEGFIIAESSDLLYGASDDEQEIEKNINKNKYYGEVEFQMEYKGKKGVPFNWLFADPDVLSASCNKNGLAMDLLFENGEGGFLVKLYVLE